MSAPYAVKCDECKTTIRTTMSERESFAGGRCERCKAPKPCAGCGDPSAPGDWLCGQCRINAESRMADLSDPHNVRGYVQEMRDVGWWDGE